MKPDMLGALAAATLVWLVALPTEAANKQDDAIFAICRGKESRVDPAGGDPPLRSRPGWATAAFPIATTAAPAQAYWFNYGIRLYHAFYHDDAKRAFDKAVTLDPKCAMCLWGQALSRGPVMNFDVDEADIKARPGNRQARPGHGAYERGTGCSPPRWCAATPGPRTRPPNAISRPI